jgi:hypothetical protein
LKNKCFIDLCIDKLIEYRSEYQFIAHSIKHENNFYQDFEVSRTIRTLDNKSFLLAQKIDPIYESLIKNNFKNTSQETFLAILHRTSILDTIIKDLELFAVHF